MSHPLTPISPQGRPRRPSLPPPYPFTTYSPGTGPPYTDDIFTNEIYDYPPPEDEYLTTPYVETPSTDPPFEEISGNGIQYLETPSAHRDDYVEVYEVSLDQVQDKSDDDQTILKDFLQGQAQPSRRPNSYFYDEPMPEEKADVMESNFIDDYITTPSPTLSDSPLPTYKSYTGGPTTPAFPELDATLKPTTSPNFYETPSWKRQDEQDLLESLEQTGQDVKAIMTTDGPKLFTISHVTGAPIYQSSTRPSRTTSRQQQTKTAKRKRNNFGGTGTAHTYQQLGNQDQISVNLVYETTTTAKPTIIPSSSIFQQIGNQVNVNISTPSDRAWLEVVTANPSLLRGTSPPSPTPQISLSTTLQPASYYETPSWNRQDKHLPQIEEVFPVPQVTVSPKGEIPALKGYLSSPTPSPSSYSPTTPASSFSLNTGIQWGTSSKTNKRKDIISTLKSNRPNWRKQRQKQKSKLPAKQLGLNLTKELSALIPSTKPTTRPRTTPPSPVSWTATARPPPGAVTSPGWHIHSNANIGSASPTVADSRADSFSTNQPTEASVSVRGQFTTPRPNNTRGRRKPNIHQKLKSLYKAQKTGGNYKRIKSKKPRVFKFTSNDAISKAARRVEDISIQAPDTKTAGSMPRVSVAKPVQGSRRLDSGSSLLLKHKVPQPREKPLKKKGGWLLLGPKGASFHFDTLQQVLDLNQNYFVPG